MIPAAALRTLLATGEEETVPLPMPLKTFTLTPLVTPGPPLMLAALGILLVLILGLPCALFVTLGPKLPTAAMLTLLVAFVPVTEFTPMLPVVLGARMFVAITDVGKPLDETAEGGATGTPPSELPVVESFLDTGLEGGPPGMDVLGTAACDEWWWPW